MVTKNKGLVPKKGDVVWLNFSPQSGREQKGRRPALVVSSHQYNQIGLMLACPITSRVKGYPFEVPIKTDMISGCVLADHVKNQDWKTRQIKYISKAPAKVLAQTQEIIASLLIN